jgi:hypothetical protein
MITEFVGFYVGTHGGAFPTKNEFSKERNIVNSGELIVNTVASGILPQR